MRKIVFILSFMVFSLHSKAQNPDIFNTWYLHHIEGDLTTEVLSVEDEQLSSQPYLIINEDLTVEGEGVCNSFTGTMIYDDDGYEFLSMSVFNATDTECELENENNFESTYFSLISSDGPQYIYINTYANYQELRLDRFTGFVTVYRNTRLSISESEKAEDFIMYPNPVKDKLHLVHNNTNALKTLSIYDFSGRLVSKVESVSSTIDVSELSQGIYFIELVYKNQKTTKKRFIKN